MTNFLAVAEGLEPSNFRINSPALYQLSYATICALPLAFVKVWTGREVGNASWNSTLPNSRTFCWDESRPDKSFVGHLVISDGPLGC